MFAPLMKKPSYKQLLRCPVSLRAQGIMLALRHHRSGFKKIDISEVHGEILRLKKQIASMDYEKLKYRKDLIFFIDNCLSTVDDNCRRELRVCRYIVSAAIEQFSLESGGLPCSQKTTTQL